MPLDTFLRHLDKGVIEAMPDVLGLPHLHFDTTLLVIYFGILYCGCTLSAADDFPQNQSRSYIKMLYVSCLRAIPGWQQQASGTVLDLVAAMLMVYMELHSNNCKLTALGACLIPVL
jgi:hypothetical protein